MEKVIKLIITIAVLMWVSFTIYIIIPKLEGVEMTVGLSMVLGILTGSFAWIEKLKLDDTEKERCHHKEMEKIKAAKVHKNIQ